MRALANGFLLVFALDATLSVVETLILPQAITGLRQFVASVAFLWSIPTFLALGFAPGLPKRVLLPPIFYLPFRALAGMPLPLYVGLESLDGVLAGIQGAVALLAFWLVQRGNRGRSLLLREEQVEQPRPSLGHALRFALGTVVLVPLLGGLYTVVCVQLTLDRLTAGFIELRRDGLHALEREYTLDGRTVRLIAMMHIGNRTFYEDVLGSLTEGALVLAEGVTDEGALLENDLSYEAIAETLGLDVQSRVEAAKGTLRVENADVDMSAFSASTIELLNAGTAALGETLSAEERVAAWNEFAKLGASPETLKTAMYELIDMRNAHLLARFEQVLDDAGLIVIPWGAAHMPGIESGLVERGYEHGRTVARRVVAFWTPEETEEP